MNPVLAAALVSARAQALGFTAYAAPPVVAGVFALVYPVTWSPWATLVHQAIGIAMLIFAALVLVAGISYVAASAAHAARKDT